MTTSAAELQGQLMRLEQELNLRNKMLEDKVKLINDLTSRSSANLDEYEIEHVEAQEASDRNAIESTCWESLQQYTQQFLFLQQRVMSYEMCAKDNEFMHLCACQLVMTESVQAKVRTQFFNAALQSKAIAKIEEVQQKSMELVVAKENMFCQCVQMRTNEIESELVLLRQVNESQNEKWLAVTEFSEHMIQSLMLTHTELQGCLYQKNVITIESCGERERALVWETLDHAHQQQHIDRFYSNSFQHFTEDFWETRCELMFDAFMGHHQFHDMYWVDVESMRRTSYRNIQEHIYRILDDRSLELEDLVTEYTLRKMDCVEVVVSAYREITEQRAMDRIEIGNVAMFEKAQLFLEWVQWCQYERKMMESLYREDYAWTQRGLLMRVSEHWGQFMDLQTRSITTAFRYLLSCTDIVIHAEHSNRYAIMLEERDTRLAMVCWVMTQKPFAHEQHGYVVYLEEETAKAREHAKRSDDRLVASRMEVDRLQMQLAHLERRMTDTPPIITWQQQHQGRSSMSPSPPNNNSTTQQDPSTYYDQTSKLLHYKRRAQQLEAVVAAQERYLY